MDMSAVMDGIAARVTDAGLTDRVFAYPPPAIAPPCAVVAYPESIDFDVTWDGGPDQATFPVYMIAGKVSERTARDVLSAFVTGATSLKAAIEGEPFLGGAADTVRVTEMRITGITVSGIEYLSALFDVEVVA